MVASVSVNLSKKSQDAFIAFYEAVQNTQYVTRDAGRNNLERMDRAYQRVDDLTEEHLRAVGANRMGDTARYQNMTVPVVMPQVEAAVTHQTAVFLTGQPIFGVVASPEYIDEAMQMQSILEDESVRNGWARELILFFRDGAKYNESYIEVDWIDEVTYSVETDIETSITEGIPREVIWSGNRIRRLDPYNTFVDQSCEPAEVYKKGDFAGYTEFMTRIQLKSFIAALPDKIIANIVPAFESGSGSVNNSSYVGTGGYYVPEINPDVNTENDRIGTNWEKWAGISNTGGRKINYHDNYDVTTIYARILPSEFALTVPNANTPQVYKLVIVNHQHIIYAERQTNAHGYIPIFVGQPLEDGLGYQTKSLAENGLPFQQLATTYMDSIIAAKRRSIGDRTIYDPSRITSAAINSSNPSAKIPVRPSAYGSKISDSVYAFPFRDDQSPQAMQQIQTLLGLANSLAGQNQAQQGQFVKGNKTLHEYESVMQNAAGRDQLAAILLEFQVFVPVKQVLKLNILQYQGGTTIYNREEDRVVEIDPVQLRKAVLEFKVSDGLVPASKLINGESFSVALQVMGSSPEIAAGYNVPQLFSYMMKTQGAKISDFEKSPEQLAYEQAVGAWQQTIAMIVDKSSEEVDMKQLPPQPTPEEFGYDPSGNKPAPNTGQQPTTPQAGPQ
jgi:hypothetical protein